MIGELGVQTVIGEFTTCSRMRSEFFPSIAKPTWIVRQCLQSTSRGIQVNILIFFSYTMSLDRKATK